MIVVCVGMDLVGNSVFCRSVGCTICEFLSAGWWCGRSKPGDLGRVMRCLLWLMDVCLGGGMAVV